MVTVEGNIGIIIWGRHGIIFTAFRWLLFRFMAAHLFIPHSRPISFNFLDTTVAFSSDLRHVLRLSTNSGCIVFWLGAWDKLYPSASQVPCDWIQCKSKQSSTKGIALQNSSCSLWLYWLSLPSLISTSSLILHVFVTDLTRFIRLKCIPLCSLKSTQLQDKFFFWKCASSGTI